MQRTGSAIRQDAGPVGRGSESAPFRRLLPWLGTRPVAPAFGPTPVPANSSRAVCGNMASSGQSALPRTDRYSHGAFPESTPSYCRGPPGLSWRIPNAGSSPAATASRGSTPARSWQDRGARRKSGGMQHSWQGPELSGQEALVDFIKPLARLPRAAQGKMD